MADCLFCKIAAGEIPSDIIDQNSDFVAFRDITPQAPTHILVIPRQHLGSLNETGDTELLGSWMRFARDVALSEGLGDDGYRIVVNTNADGGQTVFHLHAHVLGGRAMQWPPG